MPTDTGIYTPEEATYGHDFSYRLAQWIGEYLPKNEPVIDVGCGPATYLRYLHDIGFTDLYGVEGTEQNFEFGNVHVMDIVLHDVVIKKRSIGVTDVYGYLNTFKSVICLEVGEHIPEKYVSLFCDKIAKYCRRGGKLILSWAVPGQDGIGHVSCRHNIWVVNEFEKRGFKLLVDDSISARNIVENRVSYFRNTIMIFEKK